MDSRVCEGNQLTFSCILLQGPSYGGIAGARGTGTSGTFAVPMLIRMNRYPVEQVAVLTAVALTIEPSLT